jgi:hypothetical protein
VKESIMDEKVLKKAKLLLIGRFYISSRLQHRATRLLFNITSTSASTFSTTTDEVPVQGLPRTPVGARSRAASERCLTAPAARKHARQRSVRRCAADRAAPVTAIVLQRKTESKAPSFLPVPSSLHFSTELMS